MNLYNFEIALQEVPGEISLCFSISGCQLRCKGCHSAFLWNETNGIALTETLFINYLYLYKGFATCVLFMGGEWHKEKLVKFLKMAKNEHYKTCLYTGEDEISNGIMEQLTWLKTGKWVAELGGLNSKNTNQKFIDVKTNTNLNHLFIKN